MLPDSIQIPQSPAASAPHPASAFTLIELLVVVTIIVVLLALLTPAIDRAIYQAELTVCATHLHSTGVGVQTYAADSKRYYPYRRGVHDATNAINAGGTWLGNAWHPHKIWNGNSKDGNARDDRPLIRPYMGINGVLNDPLAKRADLDGAREGTSVYSTYYLWFGYRFAGQKGMNKIGDRFTWSEGPGLPVSGFNVMAGDHDDVRYLDTLPGVTHSHPDHNGILQSEVYDNAGSPTSSLARWARGSPPPEGRGPEEMNFVFESGEVRRYESVAVDADDRFTKAPVFNGATHTVTQWTHLPKQP